jgi:hypothetical protein
MSTANLPADPLTRAIRDVAAQAEREKHLVLRVSRRGGTEILGHSISVGGGHVVVVTRDGAEEDSPEVILAATDVESIFVGTANRGREAVVAIIGIVAIVGLLALSALLPWVNPKSAGPPVTYMLVLLAAIGSFEVLRRRTRLRDWLVRWQQVYPTP